MTYSYYCTDREYREGPSIELDGTSNNHGAKGSPDLVWKSETIPSLSCQVFSVLQ